MEKGFKIDISHVASLARIALTEDEKERFGSQLKVILQYIEKLNELDTSNVEPTSHVIDLRNVMREDIVCPSLPKEKALFNAPDRTVDFYRVPKIID